jgi:hypothetical protein
LSKPELEQEAAARFDAEWAMDGFRRLRDFYLEVQARGAQSLLAWCERHGGDRRADLVAFRV